jgi:hypothetical protein
MKTTISVLRLVFGVHFLVNGANFYFHFFTIPKPHSDLALQMMSALVDTGMFNIVKLVEVITGIALIANVYVPLALVVAFPVAIGVGFVDVLLIGTWFGGWVLGGGTVVLNAILLLGYLRYYRPFLTLKSEPGLG